MILLLVPLIVAIFYYLVDFFIELITLVILLITKKKKQTNDFSEVGKGAVFGHTRYIVPAALYNAPLHPSRERILTNQPAVVTIKRSDHIRIILEKLLIIVSLTLICYIVIRNDNFKRFIFVEIAIIITFTILIKFLLKFLLSRGMNNQKNKFYNMSWKKRMIGIVICVLLITGAIRIVQLLY